jgi:hypothetical protein
MKTYTNKQEAQKVSEKINNEKGFNISFPTYVGGSIYSIYGLPSTGWYVCNKETKKYY